MQIQQDMKEKSKHRCTKKECAGLDRLNPLKSFFPSPTDKSKALCPNLKHSNSPFSLATAEGSGDSVKTGQREPMGLWVALLASVRDTVHTYRLLISRDKEVQPVPATANSLPYAVGRDKQI